MIQIPLAAWVVVFHTCSNWALGTVSPRMYRSRVACSVVLANSTTMDLTFFGKSGWRTMATRRSESSVVRPCHSPNATMSARSKVEIRVWTMLSNPADSSGKCGFGGWPGKVAENSSASSQGFIQDAIVVRK